MPYTERSKPQIVLNKMTKAVYDSIEKDPDQLYAVTDADIYDLPVASANTLGGIKVGQNLTISGDGTLNAQDGGEKDLVYTTPTKVGKYNGKDVWRVSVSLSGVSLPGNQITTVASNILSTDGWISERTMFLDCRAYLSDSTNMYFQVRTPHLGLWDGQIAFLQAIANPSAQGGRGMDLAINNYRYGSSAVPFVCDSRSYITVDFVSDYR